ncbi:MAG TPA: PASTA domain-containing protein [Gaiellaceae bacterium]
MRTAFVEECRQEWKRLGVPDGLAEEMATELESDLGEAQADGVSAAELLGESDPRRFAATWARERGLVSEPAPPRRRRRVWPWVVVAVFVLVVLLLTWLALQSWGSGSASTHGARPTSVVTRARRVAVPNVVGLEGCQAERIALAAGFIVQHVPRKRCHDQVVTQRPAPGTIVQRLKPRNTVKLRLRG